MNYDCEPAGRPRPFVSPELNEADFEALRARIRRATTGRTAMERAAGRASAVRRPVRRMLLAAVSAAAAALLAAGVFSLAAHREAPPERGLDALLATASAETVVRAAAENYDDILYDQQL